jgi:hypothetical protein
MTPLYKELSERATEYRERADCAVRALAVAADVPYAEAHAALAEAGRKRGRGTYHNTLVSAISALGREATRVRPERPLTMKSVAEYYATGRYIICVRGHFAGLAHGEVHDWTAGSRRRVKFLYRIE